MELTAANVRDVYQIVRTHPAHDALPGIPVHGLSVEPIYFNPSRLMARRADITAMLRQLHQNFSTDGNGYTFMELPFRADGVQWGEQADAAILVLLGVATQQIILAPREVWHLLPGGVPYVLVVVKPIEAAKG